MGITRYLSRTEGIGGRLKLSPEAFRVDEVSRYPPPNPNGRFTIARVESVEIEQNELLHRLSRELSLPPGRIGFAGTKDRRAVTTQLLSFPLPPAEVQGTLLSGVRIADAYRATVGIYLGHLYGNCFEIRIAEVPEAPPVVISRVQAIEKELREMGGYPNYYGPQRFGEVRPVTHLVGRALVLGSVKEAVETYLTVHAEGEVEDGTEARRRYSEHHDPKRALEEFPRSLRLERMLLERLARGDPHERAFRAFSRNLRTLFVHAFQSYLFNRTLSLRIDRGLSLKEPLVGDWLIRIGHDGLAGPLPPVCASADNLPEMTHLVSAGRARIAIPLVGTETPSSKGTAGELLEGVLREEGVIRENFRLTEVPELSSEGTYRAVLGRMPMALFHHGIPRPEGDSLSFFFPLDKGEYATVLLREFTKAGAAPPA